MRSESDGMRRVGSERGTSRPRGGGGGGRLEGGRTAGVAEEVEADPSPPATVVADGADAEAAAEGSTSIAVAIELEAAAVPSAEGTADGAPSGPGGLGTTAAGGGALDASSALMTFLTSSASFSDKRGIPSLSGGWESLKADGEGLAVGPAGRLGR